MLLLSVSFSGLLILQRILNSYVVFCSFFESLLLLFPSCRIFDNFPFSHTCSVSCILPQPFSLYLVFLIFLKQNIWSHYFHFQSHQSHAILEQLLNILPRNILKVEIGDIWEPKFQEKTMHTRVVYDRLSKLGLNSLGTLSSLLSLVNALQFIFL